MTMGQKRGTVTFSQYGVNMVAELSRENNMYYYMDMDSSLQSSSLSEVRTYFKRRMEEFILKQVSLTESKYKSLKLEGKGFRFSENDYLAALYSLSRKKVLAPELWTAIKSNYESRGKKERLEKIREKMSFKTVHRAGRKNCVADNGNEGKRRVADGGNKAESLYPEHRKPMKRFLLEKIMKDFSTANNIPDGCMRTADINGCPYMEITDKDLYILFPLSEIHNVVVNAQRSGPNLAFVFLTGPTLYVSYRKGRLKAQKSSHNG